MKPSDSRVSPPPPRCEFEKTGGAWWVPTVAPRPEPELDLPPTDAETLLASRVERNTRLGHFRIPQIPAVASAMISPNEMATLAPGSAVPQTGHGRSRWRIMWSVKTDARRTSARALAMTAIHAATMPVARREERAPMVQPLKRSPAGRGRGYSCFIYRALAVVSFGP